MGSPDEGMKSRETTGRATSSPARPSAVDVARLAGVSQSAVSRAFTPGASVGPETRKKVIAAAAKVGYLPNAIARGLITKRTNIVGLILADLANPFYAEALRLLSEELQRGGRQLLLFTLAPGQSVDAIMPSVLQYQVDAVVVTSATVTSSIVERATERGAPVILFNRSVPGTQAHTVTFDDVAAGRLAGDLLAAAGHRRFWYVAGHRDTSTGIARERGFLAALAERGITDVTRFDGHYSHRGGYLAVRDALAGGDARPDAIVGANDLVALGALDAVRDHGLRVPDDVSVMGCDDIPQAAWSAYGLTTLRVGIDEMVGATVSLIDALRQGKARGRHGTVVRPVLVERRSARIGSPSPRATPRGGD